jgi:chitodextrinase
MNALKLIVLFVVVALGFVRAEPSVTVSGKTYNTGAVVNEWAQYTLQTGGSVIVKDGANVAFSAGSQITLYPGFSVEPGGTFRATTSAIPSYNPGGYYTGFTPTLALLSGNQQYGTIGQFNLQPFDVAVWNAAGTAPLINAPVLLTVGIGGGWLSETNDTNAFLTKTLYLMTDGDGTVSAYYQQGSTVGVTSYIQVVAGTQILQFTTYSTLDIAIPTVPVGLAFSNLSTSGFTLTWSPSYDSVAVTGYDVFKDGLFIGSSVTTSYVVGGLMPETTYSMTVKAKDADGHISDASAPLSVTTPDITAPSAPTNLAASNLTTTGVTLTWSTSTDNIAVAGYDIYQNNVLIGSSSAPVYIVTGLTPVATYSFTVKAKDAANNISAASSAVSVTTLTPVTPIAEVAGSFLTGKTRGAAPAGTNRLLVFVAQSESSGTLNTVTYGGRGLIRAVNLTNSTNEVSIWYLDDAGITAASNTTFVTSWSGSESGEGYSSFVLTGVDQANPVKAIRSAADPYTTANVSIPTSSITVANGDYSVFAAVRGGAAGAFTFGGGFAERLHYAITSGDAAMATRASTTGETITPAVAHATAAERMTLAVCVFQPAPYEIAPKVAVTEVVGSLIAGNTSALVPVGDNRLLVFVAQGGFAGTLNSVTYGEQTMTRAVSMAQGETEVSIWYLKDAGIQSATSRGFIASWSTSEPRSRYGYSSFFLTNVEQANPVGAITTASYANFITNAHVSTASLAVAPGDYSAFSVVTGVTGSFTFSRGYTQRLLYAGTGFNAALATRAVICDPSITPTVAYSGNSSQGIALAACVFKPAPSAPTNLAASAISTTSFTLTWDAAFDNVAVTGYDVYQNGVFVGSTNALSYGVTGLASGTAYTMTVKARDADGNTSAASAPLVVTTSNDGQAPSVPTGLVASNLGATGFTLTWSASTDNIGVTGYDIFQGGVLLGTSTTPGYAVTGLAPLTTYSMTVKARDAVGNISAASAVLSVTTTADTTAPAAPTGLAAASLSATSFMLSWNASTDNIGVTGYDIFKDGVQIGSSSTLAYTVSGLAPASVYTMTVKAKDAAGNVSIASPVLYVATAPDSTAPAAPTGLVASALGTTTFTLSWNAASDDVAVTGYDVYRNGTLVGSSATLSYAVTGLSPGTAYNMTVKAKDAANNVSAASATLAVTTVHDTQAPTVPSGLIASSLATTGFTLSWNAASDNIAVTGYNIFQDGVQIGTSATLSYAVSGLTPATVYSMTVKARDAAGNVSAASTALPVTTLTPPDTTAPSAPTNLTSSLITTTTFTLTWTAATDNVGVAEYVVYQDNAQVGSPVATTSLGVSGLTAGAAYSMTVKARDAAGNVSAASQALTVTTQSAAPSTAAWETAFFGATGVNFSANPDGDALTNLQEYEQGRHPLVSDDGIDFYVDAVLGNDATYNGHSVWPGQPTAAHGPKATLTAAITAAATGDSILILSDPSGYQATTLSLTGKNLVLRPVGNVIIHP